MNPDEHKTLMADWMKRKLDELRLHPHQRLINPALALTLDQFRKLKCN